MRILVNPVDTPNTNFEPVDTSDGCDETRKFKTIL